MAAKIIDGKCICTVEGLDFEVTAEKSYSLCGVRLNAYNKECNIEYYTILSESDDDKNVELLNMLKKVISFGKVRLTADNYFRNLTFTEEYEYDDKTLVRSRYNLSLQSRVDVKYIIEQRKREEEFKQRITQLEQENCALRLELAKFADLKAANV